MKEKMSNKKRNILAAILAPFMIILLFIIVVFSTASIMVLNIESIHGVPEGEYQSYIDGKVRSSSSDPYDGPWNFSTKEGINFAHGSKTFEIKEEDSQSYFFGQPDNSIEYNWEFKYNDETEILSVFIPENQHPNSGSDASINIKEHQYKKYDFTSLVVLEILDWIL